MLWQVCTLKQAARLKVVLSDETTRSAQIFGCYGISIFYSVQESVVEHNRKKFFFRQKRIRRIVGDFAVPSPLEDHSQYWDCPLIFRDCCDDVCSPLQTARV